MIFRIKSYIISHKNILRKGSDHVLDVQRIILDNEPKLKQFVGGLNDKTWLMYWMAFRPEIGSPQSCDWGAGVIRHRPKFITLFGNCCYFGDTRHLIVVEHGRYVRDVICLFNILAIRIWWIFCYPFHGLIWRDVEGCHQGLVRQLDVEFYWQPRTIFGPVFAPRVVQVHEWCGPDTFAERDDRPSVECYGIVWNFRLMAAFRRHCQNIHFYRVTLKTNDRAIWGL